MHYKLDPKVIDASSVPSFDSLPIHHKIHPKLIDAYMASTKCVARASTTLKKMQLWKPSPMPTRRKLIPPGDSPNQNGRYT